MGERTILIVEDDKTLVDVLRYNLVKEGYRVVTVFDGNQALEVARRDKPDLIILDIMLPKIDGLEVCRILRNEMTTPVLMLTAKDEEIDKVVGLEIGADDYMTKPFSTRELLARIRAMLRRVEMKGPEQTVGGDIVLVNELTINITRRRVNFGGSILKLTPKEFDLLAFLARNKGIVF